jgi:hypothetical protein
MSISGQFQAGRAENLNGARVMARHMPVCGRDKIAIGAYLQSFAGPPILIQHYQNRESDSTIVRW